MKFTFNNINIKLRIDRIDELSDGSQLIIDYKTGKNLSIQDWFGDRPLEPQMPLYCLVNKTHTIGLAFGQLHPDQLNLIGISKYPIDISTIKTFSDIRYANDVTWEQQLTHWETTLTKLSNEFQQGYAYIDPKEGSETCRLCHLHALCRIHEYNQDEYNHEHNTIHS